MSATPHSGSDGDAVEVPPPLDTFAFGSTPMATNDEGSDDPDDPFANIMPLDIPSSKPARKRVQMQLDDLDDSDPSPPRMAGRAGRKRMSVIDAIALEHHHDNESSEPTPMPASLNPDFAVRSKRRASMMDAVALMESSVPISPLASDRPRQVNIDKATIGKAEFQNIQRMFQIHDEDRSGAIDSKELGKVMLSLGHQLTEVQLADLMYEITGDRECEALDFEDFVKLILFWKDAARFRLFERETAPATQHIESTTNTGGMVLPDQPLRRLWDVLMLGSLIFIWGSVTFYYCIVGDETAINRYRTYLVPLEIINSVVMAIDVLINCFTVVVDGRHLITNGAELRKNYAKRWLAVDVIAIVPYWILIPSPAAGYINWVRTVRFLRWPAMFKISGRIPMDPSFVTFYYQLLPIVEALAVFALLVHTSAVVMIYQQTDRALSLNYSSAIYWALLVISSVGSDNVPGTNDTTGKQWYAMCVMIVGQLVNAVAVGNIVRYFQIADISAVRASKLAETAAVCQFFSIPEALSNEILQFQDHVLQHNLSLAYFNLIKGLPPEMKVHIGIYARIRFIQDHPLFMLGHEAVRVAVAQALDAVVYTPEEYVIIADDVDEDMFVVATGFLDVLSRRGGYMLTLKPGDHFGEVSLFHEAPHAVSVKTLTYCELYALGGGVFDTIMERFPTFRRSVDAYLLTLEKAPSPEDVLARTPHFTEAMAESMHFRPAMSSDDDAIGGGKGDDSPTTRRMQYLNDLSFLPRSRWETRVATGKSRSAPNSPVTLGPQEDDAAAQAELRRMSVARGVISPRASLSPRSPRALNPQTPRRAWGSHATTGSPLGKKRGSRGDGLTPRGGDDGPAFVPNISEVGFRRALSVDGSAELNGAGEQSLSLRVSFAQRPVDGSGHQSAARDSSATSGGAFESVDSGGGGGSTSPSHRASRVRGSSSFGRQERSREATPEPALPVPGSTATGKAAKRSRMDARKQAARENDVMALAQTEITRQTSGGGGTSGFATFGQEHTGLDDSSSPGLGAREATFAAAPSFRRIASTRVGQVSSLSCSEVEGPEDAVVPPAMEAAAVDSLITDLAAQMADLEQLVAEVSANAASASAARRQRESGSRRISHAGDGGSRRQSEAWSSPAASHMKTPAEAMVAEPAHGPFASTSASPNASALLPQTAGMPPNDAQSPAANESPVCSPLAGPPDAAGEACAQPDASPATRAAWEGFDEPDDVDTLTLGRDVGRGSNA